MAATLSELQACPTTDLFASRINKQCQSYVSFRADPEAYAVNAFSLPWHGLRFYAFPPFSVILQMLQKVKRDRAMGVIIVPSWLTQVWWAVLMRCPSKVIQEKNTLFTLTYWHARYQAKTTRTRLLKQCYKSPDEFLETHDSKGLSHVYS